MNSQADLPGIIPTAQRVAKLGEYVFPLLEVDPGTMEPRTGSFIKMLLTTLAYMNDPKVNEALAAYGIEIKDDNGKALFPRSDT